MFKPGDKVVCLKDPYGIQEEFSEHIDRVFTIKNIYHAYITIEEDDLGYHESWLVLEEIHNSPLYKLMSED